MHSTHNPAVYRVPAGRHLSRSEIEAAKVRLGALVEEVDSSTLLGHLKAIFILLSHEPVGEHAWRLIREAQADIAVYQMLLEERIERWTYSREDTPEQTTLDLNEVDGYPIGRTVGRSC